MTGLTCYYNNNHKKINRIFVNNYMLKILPRYGAAIVVNTERTTQWKGGTTRLIASLEDRTQELGSLSRI